ncbi:MAG: sugar phosphate isomerase/epimerase family protein [Phycisphaerae bacterium]
MNIGFSSLVCPGWNLDTVLTNAAEFGFDGVELRGLCGELDLAVVPDLAARPEDVRAQCRQRNVALICLASSATLDARRPAVVSQHKAKIIELMELAGQLGCPFVRIFAGEVQRRDHHRAALARIAKALASLAPTATSCGVTLLVENGGDFPGSDDMWFLIDAAAHPGVRCCWNQCNARASLERPTTSIPRLGRKIAMVHVCDASFDDYGVLTDYTPLGDGDAEVARQITLLRGLAYEGYLMFEWPKMWRPTLPAPEAALPGVATFLRERLQETQAPLSAYKADKNKPKFATHRV